MEEPEAGRALKSAFTIAGAYVVGGLIPLAPYFLLDTVSRALPVSIALTLAALLIFGGVKGQLTGVAPLRSALQTAIVGSLAAAAAFALRGWLAVDCAQTCQTRQIERMSSISGHPGTFCSPARQEFRPHESAHVPRRNRT